MKRYASRSAARITLVYGIVSAVWIFLSGNLLNWLDMDIATRQTMEMVKGWLFVVVTAVLLYKMIAHSLIRMVKADAQLHQKNVEISAMYEELSASEEELRQQVDELLKREVKINHQNECLHVLHEEALSIMRELEVKDLLHTIVTKMMKISGAQYGYIYMVDEGQGVMVPVAVSGFPYEIINKKVQCGEGIIGTVWETGQTVVIEKYHEWEGRLKEPIYSTLRAGVGLPLKLADKVVGVFSMNYTQDHATNEEELQMLNNFAELASIAIHNARLHQELQISQARNQAVVDALPDLILRVNRKGILQDYNLGKDFLSPFDFSQSIGKTLDDFMGQELAKRYTQKLEAAFSTKTTQQFEYQILIDNRCHWREVRLLTCGEYEAIAVVRDVTDRVEMQRKLHYDALHDRVTGLYNRVYFEDELHVLEAIGSVPVGIIICDIDGLKLVNDTLGHQSGDELLKNTAKLLQECFGSPDIVARVGGDEFAVVLPGKNYEDMEVICQNLRQRIQSFCAGNTQIPVNISVGMSVRTTPEQPLASVFKAADDAMYREKLHSGQSTRSAIVNTLGKALEARDFVTDGHADRLQELVVKLALAAGVPESRISDLRLFGRFHDIGKVGIPDSILFKPGRLTAEEFEIMKRHCEIGYRIAKASNELAPIADWILKHQEWWNGQGYPLGLKGEEIPIACRILAIVDAFDAMTNDRPYRKALSAAAAVVELERCAGTQFDPAIVQTFKTIIDVQECTRQEAAI